MGARSRPTRPMRLPPLVVGLIALAPLGGFAVRRAAAEDGALGGRVATLLAVRCLECHAGEDPQGGLGLENAEAISRGGVTGPAIVPGDADASLLVRAVRRQDPAVAAMPPEEPLSAEEIALVEAWIAAGASWPANAVAEDDDGSPVGSAWEDPRNPVTRRWRGERIDLWSFQPLVRPPVPSAIEALISASPPVVIDAFLAEKLEAAGLEARIRSSRASIWAAVFDLS